MKKIHGTKYSTVARSEYPAVDKMEDQIKAQRARLDALIQQVKKMLDAQ